MIAPYLKDKKVDPAVICIDDKGQFAISLLSGHVGRANEFTNLIANKLGAQAVITTASDVQNTLTVDILGRELGWRLEDDHHNITAGCAAVVNEEDVSDSSGNRRNPFLALEESLPSWCPLSSWPNSSR